MIQERQGQLLSLDGSSCLRTKWNCRSIPIRLFWIWEKHGLPAAEPMKCSLSGCKVIPLKTISLPKKVRIPLMAVGRCYARHFSTHMTSGDQRDWAEAINEWNKRLGMPVMLSAVSGIHIGIKWLRGIQIKCTQALHKWVHDAVMEAQAHRLRRTQHREDAYPISWRWSQQGQDKVAELL